MIRLIFFIFVNNIIKSNYWFILNCILLFSNLASVKLCYKFKKFLHIHIFALYPTIVYLYELFYGYTYDAKLQNCLSLSLPC